MASWRERTENLAFDGPSDTVMRQYELELFELIEYLKPRKPAWSEICEYMPGTHRSISRSGIQPLRTCHRVVASAFSNAASDGSAGERKRKAWSFALVNGTAPGSVNPRAYNVVRYSQYSAKDVPQGCAS